MNKAKLENRKSKIEDRTYSFSGSCRTLGHSRRTSTIYFLFPALSCFLLSALLFAGCAKRETRVEQGDRDQVLHLGNGSEPKDLDPHLVTGVTEHNIISALLEGLVAEDPKTLAPVPGSASHWDVTEDGLTYTFHLRPKAKWSNGDPVTAEDFVFSYKRMLTPALGSPYAYMLYCLRNAEPYSKGTLTDFAEVGVRAIDAKTLQLTLRAPTPYFLSLLNHFSWFPIHPQTILAHGDIATIGSQWTKPENFVGNGPFTLTEWQANKQISVSKSKTYWDRKTVRLNAIHFHPIGDHTIEEHAFRAGQLHVTGTVPIDRIAYYQTRKPELLRLDPYLGCYYYLFNVNRAPLDNPKVRKALALAINREQITKFVTRANELPAFNFTPPNTGGYTARAQLEGDLATARKLLAEAGFPEGKGFPTLSVLYNTADSHARIAEVLQQMWITGLGINIELVNMEWKVYLAQTQTGDYDIARAGWIGDYVDPNSFLDMWITDGGNNRAGWSNSRYDALIRSASETPDPAKRQECFQDAEAILMDEVPIMPIYFYRSKSLIQPSVRGWHPTLLDHHPYKHLWLEAEEQD
ncbi:MAG: peptide ABC transporter substrate-binding protein [Verrucomicrobia bacterium]|jgi:oligopeptide transport system substrate-binding protein|nr:peptide ABC transporter substrate-binding protein [Verrucomicrobiota bacterium]